MNPRRRERERRRRRAHTRAVRLGPYPDACDTCGGTDGKYHCPRCGHRSCSLACVVAHKEGGKPPGAVPCSGKRDRAAFLKPAEMTVKTLRSDIALLDDIGNAARAVRKAVELGEARLGIGKGGNAAGSSGRRGGEGGRGGGQGGGWPALPAGAEDGGWKTTDPLAMRARERGVELRRAPPGSTARRESQTRWVPQPGEGSRSRRSGGCGGGGRGGLGGGRGRGRGRRADGAPDEDEGLRGPAAPLPDPDAKGPVGGDGGDREETSAPAPAPTLAPPPPPPAVGHLAWTLRWRFPGGPAPFSQGPGLLQHDCADAGPGARTMGTLLVAALAAVRATPGRSADAAALRAVWEAATVVPTEPVPEPERPALLLRVDGRPADRPAFRRIAWGATLLDALRGSVVAEVPVVYVIPPGPGGETPPGEILDD